MAACEPVRGGGYISGRDGGKANFAFALKCDKDGLLTGPWSYSDKGVTMNGLKVHITGDISSFPQSCSDGTPGEPQLYSSTYTAQGGCTTDCTGDALFFVYDDGDHGSMKGDCVAVSLGNGPFDDYFNFDGTATQCPDAGGLKPVLGGNLRVG